MKTAARKKPHNFECLSEYQLSGPGFLRYLRKSVKVRKGTLK